MKRFLATLLTAVMFIFMTTRVWAVSFGSSALTPGPYPMPTDPTGAVAEEGSDSWLVTDQNEHLYAFKNGTAQSTCNNGTGANFWHDTFSDCDETNLNTACNIDPRILYDPTDHANNGHWLVTSVDESLTNLYVGVSQTGDPTGSWWKWRTNAACALFSTYTHPDFTRLAGC